MKADRASIRYAKALLELANENQKEKSVLEEMQNILSIMESSPALDKALNSPILLGSQKRIIINKVFVIIAYSKINIQIYLIHFTHNFKIFF